MSSPVSERAASLPRASSGRSASSSSSSRRSSGGGNSASLLGAMRVGRRPQDTSVRDTLVRLPQPGGLRRRPSSGGRSLKLANVLPPSFVAVLVLTIWSVYTAFHVLPLLQLELPSPLRDRQEFRRGVFDFCVVEAFTALLLVCYCRAMLTLPGSVPDSFEWKMIGEQEADGGLHYRGAAQTREVKLTGERRHCKWCLVYKPDRCHHCRVCNTCVLRMDHHCPWIMNCVGFRNHKYFFLLVVYSVCSCGFVACTLLGTVRRSQDQEMPIIHRFAMVLGLVLSVIMGTLMAFFLSFHTHLMLSGMTTIEYCEKSAMAPTGLPVKRQSYDRGLYRNVSQVLGPRPLLWLLPTCPPEGDGTVFTSKGHTESLEEADPEWTSTSWQGLSSRI